MEDKQVILKAMKEAGKPIRTGEIAETTGIDKKEITKLFKELKKDGKIISPKRCFYSLPE